MSEINESSAKAFVDEYNEMDKRVQYMEQRLQKAVDDGFYEKDGNKYKVSGDAQAFLSFRRNTYNKGYESGFACGKDEEIKRTLEGISRDQVALIIRSFLCNMLLLDGDDADYFANNLHYQILRYVEHGFLTEEEYDKKTGRKRIRKG